MGSAWLLGIALLSGCHEAAHLSYENEVTEACIDILLDKKAWSRVTAKECRRWGREHDCKLHDHLSSVYYIKARQELREYLVNNWTHEERLWLRTWRVLGIEPVWDSQADLREVIRCLGIDLRATAKVWQPTFEDGNGEQGIERIAAPKP